MLPQIVVETASRLIDMLSRGQYGAVIAECSESRLTADDLRQVMKDYGRTFVSPPAEVIENINAIDVNNRPSPTWHVRVPMCTTEEGRSDLELEFTISLTSNGAVIELEDLHVL